MNLNILDANIPKPAADLPPQFIIDQNRRQNLPTIAGLFLYGRDCPGVKYLTKAASFRFYFLQIHRIGDWFCGISITLRSSTHYKQKVLVVLEDYAIDKARLPLAVFDRNNLSTLEVVRVTDSPHEMYDGRFPIKKSLSNLMPLDKQECVKASDLARSNATLLRNYYFVRLRNLHT